jgi:hypothetical protein
MLKTGLEGREEGRGEDTNSRPSLLHRTTGTCNTTTFNHAAAQFRPVLRIRIHMFLGLPDPDPDPLVRYLYGSGSFPITFKKYGNKQKNLEDKNLVDVLKVTDENSRIRSRIRLWIN